MQMTGFNVFEFIYQTYLTSIAGSITSVVDKALAAAQGPLLVTLTLLVMIYGYDVIAAQGTTFRTSDGAGACELPSWSSWWPTPQPTILTWCRSLRRACPNFFAQHIAGAPGGTNPGAGFDKAL